VPSKNFEFDKWFILVYNITMYIRVKTTPNSPRKSVQIVQSQRQGNKVKQKIVRHVGIAMDDQELDQLKKLAESIRIKLEADDQKFLISPEELSGLKKKNVNKEEDDSAYKVNLKDLKEVDRVVSGIHDIYGRLFDEMGYNKIFYNPARQKMVVNIFRDIVLARISNPLSKRATVDMLEEDFGVSIPLEKVYRMMDKIDDTAIERINKITYTNTLDLYGNSLDIIFFDATTIYFESFTEDDFRICGYSKDLKFNQPQVLFAMLVTKDGLPVGYRLFEGNMYEGHTLLPVLNDLRNNYNIDKVVFVADSALFNKDNLKILRDNDYKYIVGARLKNMSDNLKNKILNKENYKLIEKGFSTARFSYKSDGKLIVSYKESRARKDRKDREKAINRLLRKYKKSKSFQSYLSNYGYKKYLKVSGDSKVELDKEKMKSDGEWDGLHGVITNVEGISDSEILSQYGNLWNIEDAFRITKHDLKVRPVFHWNESRVKAHIAIVFTAFCLVKYMEYRIKLQYKKMSPEKIRLNLIKVQTSILIDERRGFKYGLPSKISQDARKIYAIFRAKHDLTPFLIK
jgi:transposase